MLLNCHIQVLLICNVIQTEVMVYHREKYTGVLIGHVIYREVLSYVGQLLYVSSTLTI